MSAPPPPPPPSTPPSIPPTPPVPPGQQPPRPPQGHPAPQGYPTPQPYPNAYAPQPGYPQQGFPPPPGAPQQDYPLPAPHAPEQDYPLRAPHPQQPYPPQGYALPTPPAPPAQWAATQWQVPQQLPKQSKASTRDKRVARNRVVAAVSAGVVATVLMLGAAGWWALSSNLGSGGSPAVGFNGDHVGDCGMLTPDQTRMTPASCYAAHTGEVTGLVTLPTGITSASGLVTETTDLCQTIDTTKEAAQRQNQDDLQEADLSPDWSHYQSGQRVAECVLANNQGTLNAPLS